MQQPPLKFRPYTQEELKMQQQRPLTFEVIRRYTQEELKELAKFCPCSVCEMFWLNPSRIMACGHCVGCLKTNECEDHPNHDSIVAQARARKELAENSCSSRLGSKSSLV